MPKGYGYAGSGNTKNSGKKKSPLSSDTYMNPSKAPKKLEKKAKKRSF